MRWFYLWLGLFCIPGLLAAGSGESPALITANSSEEKEQPLVKAWVAESGPFATLYQKLEKDFDRFGNSERMIRSIFYRSHQHLFHKYRQFTLDQDALTEGLYDCVSGSLILAALLDHFGFSFEVIETSYHVFLQVVVEENQLFLEVTDPQGGFITDPDRKKQYISGYFGELGDRVLWEGEKAEESFASPEIYQKINFQNLLGLQYFNQAIRYFNEGNPLAAYQFSVTALKYHDSERIRDFSHFLKQELVLANI
ncbi:hypothetical protein [Cyclobacterium jeungdonense]|uniref:Protein SirB1 N-terminal domain-containing protein n=1 Tax=Cyclobacterium jeungdonense TaxID=708087 RepID=A0ABT8C4I1_9BACT|nr:hypothetical protein [Cyclobacterium jeungdonense]MDN3687216.1 hypothetical protein [Cyclobacterium jeungdonense]